MAADDTTSASGGLPSLIADIGGTHARFALCDGTARGARVLRCDDHADPVAAAEAYLEGAATRPKRGAFAVASPVITDRIDMTNHPWSFSIEDVRKRLGFDALKVINDFAAIALAVPHLGEEDVVPVGGGRAAPGAPIVIIGPGTGLGVSALVPVGDGWQPIATEGGHATMAPATDRESAVLARLRRVRGHASAEVFLSGPGLVNLYESLCELDGVAPEADVTPETVTEWALAGAPAAAVEALEMFSAMLGTAASNLCLSLGARGGVYIAGGIVPKLGPAFAASGFRRRFEDKGRFSDYLAQVPTSVITAELPAFIGLCALVGDGPGAPVERT